MKPGIEQLFKGIVSLGILFLKLGGLFKTPDVDVLKFLLGILLKLFGNELKEVQLIDCCVDCCWSLVFFCKFS